MTKLQKKNFQIKIIIKKMAKQKLIKGSVLEIEIDIKKYCYAQILEKSGFAFFDYESKEKLSDFSILQSTPILFILAVYNDAVSKGRWLIVGKMAIREDLKLEPMKFIQDALNPNKFELYNPNTGEISLSSKEECKGLECAAVWEAYAVEQRIRDYYSGNINFHRQEDLKIFED
jgi:hypothetical protein